MLVSEFGVDFALIGAVMQFAITALAVTAGMVFSLAVAIFVEELIFGKVFRLFARPAEPVQSGQKR